jgi:phage baseplate assembly protein V
MSGVAVGVVINNQDPQGLGRVQVMLPNYSDLDIGHWARIAVLMAGNQRGTFFLPEVGDEVLVAFEGGDLERPFILGGLWNGQDNPPDANADGKNNKRIIKSRSGHVVLLDDTDGSEKIEIVDKSGNNSLTFDTANNTITITSAQDIHLDASQGTIKLTAQNVSISSTADTTIEPQGDLTLEADGNATIKGAVVNIN